MKKYELIDRTIIQDGRELYRIKALKGFNNVVKGQIGGFVENEHNLSHRGNAWVYDKAKVYNRARISQNAIICGKAQVYEKAQIYGRAKISENSKVYGNVEVNEDAEIYESACVHGHTTVSGYAEICGTAEVHGTVRNEDIIISGYNEIIEGIWTISPLIIDGLFYKVKTVSNTKIKIGCKVLTYTDWLKNYKEIGKKENLSKSEVEEFRFLITFLAKWLIDHFGKEVL